VVNHLSQHPKVNGSDLAIAVAARLERMTKYFRVGLLNANMERLMKSVTGHPSELP
jgi:hypothetical protein